MTGTLYLVATPIGNLEDVTLRALRILREVDLVACEDTRHTAKLLLHYAITTPRESYHEHNEASRTPRLLSLLRQGKSVALVSDAGTPLISDPGRTLVHAAAAERIPIVPIPGPVAAVAALSASALSTDSFFFAGFLNTRPLARRKRLEEIAGVPATLVFYEAPHRLLESLEDMRSVLGPRQACLVRELTKIHEEWIRGTLDEILETMRARPKIAGEITIVVARGEAVRPRTFPASISEHVTEQMRRTGESKKDALRSVARQRGISRREAYKALVEEPGGKE